MKERLKVLILWVLVVCLQTFVPSMESSNGQSDQTHASITRTAIYIATADVINNVIDLEKHNSSAAIETVIEYFSKCYSFLSHIILANLELFSLFLTIKNKSVKQLDQLFLLFCILSI